MRIFETITAVFPFASLSPGESVSCVRLLLVIPVGKEVGFNSYKWLFSRKPKNPI
jgi:hypothetical protein